MSIKVDVWQGEIVTDHRQFADYEPLLDIAEKIRAQNFKIKSLQLRYVIVHGLLRKILAKYLQQSPESIPIAKAEHGKPYLITRPELAFNISHTENRLVIAVANDCQLGIDIEYYKPRANLAAIVEHYFAASEAVYWHSLPEAEQLLAFYRLWTAKEAFLKASGLGIALGLNQCIFNFELPNRLLAVPKTCGEVSDWHLVSLELGQDICCNLVVNKAIAGVSVHSLLSCDT